LSNTFDFKSDTLNITWDVFKNMQPLAAAFADQHPSKSVHFVQEQLGPTHFNGVPIHIKRM